MTGLSFDNRMLLHHEPSSSSSGGSGGSGSGGDSSREGRGEPEENFATKFPNSLESETDPPAADTVNESLQEAGEEDRNMEESQADFAPSGWFLKFQSLSLSLYIYMLKAPLERKKFSLYVHRSLRSSSPGAPGSAACDRVQVGEPKVDRTMRLGSCHCCQR